MKAFVVGCGEMGATVVCDLYHYGGFDEILIGTRSLEKANAVIATLRDQPTKVQTVNVDAGRQDELGALMKGFDVAVNCAGPNYKYECSVAQAAIAARVNLVDINDDYQTTFEMLDLDRAAREVGVMIVLGLGASPGVNNVLVRAAANQLDEVEEIRTAWVMSGADPGGLALSYHLLYSLSGKALTFQEGQLVEVQSFVDGKERIEFPEPVGAVDVYHVGHPEPITLSRCFDGVRYVDNKASFRPPSVNELIVTLGSLVRKASGPIDVGGCAVDAMDFAAAYLNNACKSMTDIDKGAALRVSVKGKKRGRDRTVVFSSAGRLAMGTGIPASIGAILLTQGKIEGAGVQPPEACIEPNDFLYEMIERRDVSKLNGWIEE